MPIINTYKRYMYELNQDSVYQRFCSACIRRQDTCFTQVKLKSCSSVLNLAFKTVLSLTMIFFNSLQFHTISFGKYSSVHLNQKINVQLYVNR